MGQILFNSSNYSKFWPDLCLTVLIIKFEQVNLITDEQYVEKVLHELQTVQILSKTNLRLYCSGVSAPVFNTKPAG